MDTDADDLSALIEALDLQGAVLIGFQAGGGEVARYIGRHGTRRVAQAALISAVPPLMLKTAANPGGLPLEASARCSSRLVPAATLKIHPGAPQGLMATHQAHLNAELLAFVGS